jgi:hypothetical protein
VDVLVARQAVVKVTTLGSPGAALRFSVKLGPLPITIEPVVLGIGSGAATIVSYTYRRQTD